MAKIKVIWKTQALDIAPGFDMSNNDAGRILTYLHTTKFAKVTEDVGGVPTVRDATDTELLTAYFRDFVADLMGKAISHQKDLAWAAANASIPPIVAIPE